MADRLILIDKPVNHNCAMLCAKPSLNWLAFYLVVHVICRKVYYDMVYKTNECDCVYNLSWRSKQSYFCDL